MSVVTTAPFAPLGLGPGLVRAVQTAGRLSNADTGPAVSECLMEAVRDVGLDKFFDLDAVSPLSERVQLLPAT